MASDRLEELLNQIETVSGSFAELSTQLSDQLSGIVVRLSQLPGKLSSQVDGDRGESLSFVRDDDKWNLRFDCVETFDGGDCPAQYWVTKSSVEIKARAALLVPSLLAKMLKQHDAHQLLLLKANDALGLSDLTLSEMEGGKS